MITLQNVTKYFSDSLVLDHIDLTLKDGCALGLLGSNGSGKSTILRLISGIYKADGGTITCNNTNIYDNVLAKESIFFVNDETVQFHSYTLEELKKYYKGFYHNFSEELYEKMLSIINLPRKKKLNQFSKGMKRQAIVILGLACQTDYLLLDEAFDGLDPSMRIVVKRMLIDAMIDRGLTVVISSHNLAEINEICDSIALLHNGKLLLYNDIDFLKQSVHKINVGFHTPMDAFITRMEEFKEMITSDDSSNSHIAGETPVVQYMQATSRVVTLVMKGNKESIQTLIEEYTPDYIEFLPLSLDEIFAYEMEALLYGKSTS